MADHNNFVWNTSDGRNVTDTFIVADRFGKRNANIVRSVERLVELFPNEYRESQRTGANGQLVRVYEMTHAGFNYLVRKFRDSNPGMVDIFHKCFGLHDAADMMAEAGIINQQEQQIMFDGEENDETAKNNDGAVINNGETPVELPKICSQEQIDDAIVTIQHLPVDARLFPYLSELFRRTCEECYTILKETRIDQIRDAIKANERIAELERRMDDLVGAMTKPTIFVEQEIKTTGEAISMNQLAKMMASYGIQTGEIRLYEWMRDNNYLCSIGADYNLPTQQAMQMGLFVIEPGSFTKPNGQVVKTRTTRVTEKGQIYFINKFLYNQQAER